MKTPVENIIPENISNAASVIMSLLNSSEHITNDDDLLAFRDFLSTLHARYKIHTVLTPRGLTDLVTYIFTDPLITDRLLSLTDQFGVMMYDIRSATTQIDPLSSLVSALSIGMTANKKGEMSLIPKPVQETIQLDENNIKVILTDNLWLVVILIILLFRILDIPEPENTVPDTRKTLKEATT